jgi:hypothetical protein
LDLLHQSSQPTSTIQEAKHCVAAHALWQKAQQKEHLS